MGLLRAPNGAPGNRPVERDKLPAAFHVLSSQRADEVVRVSERYGVPFTRDEHTGDIAHPALVFVIDAEGRLAYTLNNPSPAWVREALRRLGRAHVRAG